MWKQFKIDVIDITKLDEISDILLSYHALSVTYIDNEEQTFFTEIEDVDNLMLWEKTQIIALFEIKTDIHELIYILTKDYQHSIIKIHPIDILENKDWSTEYIKYFKPILLLNQFWILPAWCDKKHYIHNNEKYILINPGLAFGIGTHPTTLLCLEWLILNHLENKEIIDLGTGSGILAIAAAILDAKQVTAIDIDENAIMATHENAILNQVHHKVTPILNQHISKEITCDILIANILAKPLIELKETIMKYLNTKSQLVLSGILKEQAQEVMTVYQSDIHWLHVIEKEDWILLHGEKKL